MKLIITKHKILIACLLFYFILQNVFSQVNNLKINSDSIVLKKISGKELSDFKNKDLQVFLNFIGVNYKKCLWVSRKPGVINHLYFIFGDSSSFSIGFTDLAKLGYLKSKNFKFIPSKYYKKKIAWICFKYAGFCKKGSCAEDDCD